MRGLVLMLGLAGCVVPSRFAAAIGSVADAPGCGGVASAIAVGIDGAVATGILLATDELSDLQQVTLGVLAADVIVGGVMTLQDCYSE